MTDSEAPLPYFFFLLHYEAFSTYSIYCTILTIFVFLFKQWKVDYSRWLCLSPIKIYNLWNGVQLAWIIAKPKWSEYESGPMSPSLHQIKRLTEILWDGFKLKNKQTKSYPFYLTVSKLHCTSRFYHQVFFHNHENQAMYLWGFFEMRLSPRHRIEEKENSQEIGSKESKNDWASLGYMAVSTHWPL